MQICGVVPGFRRRPVATVDKPKELLIPGEPDARVEEPGTTNIEQRPGDVIYSLWAVHAIDAKRSSESCCPLLRAPLLCRD